jgi:hypothetical protein
VRGLATALAAVALALAAIAAPAAAPETAAVPGSVDEFSPQVPPASSPDQRLPGFPLTAKEALEAANRLPEVQGELARHPGLNDRVRIPSYLKPPDRWLVVYDDNGKNVLEVEVDARSGAVITLRTGYQMDWFMARGQEGQFGEKANAPYVWIPLCMAFLLPFFDPRRPLRLLHLDLLALVSFSVSLFYFNEGDVGISVPLAYPPLLYLLARALMEGFRERSGAGPLSPWAGARLLLAGAAVLTAFKIGLNLADSTVIDVGVAGVRGADRIVNGLELYVLNDFYSDAYGPVNYLAYVPFLELFGWSGRWDALPAAHAASITFDLLTLLGAYALGTKLRPGSAGRLLGAALAYAWAAFPFSTYVLQSNSNDSLVAAFVVWSLVALRSDAGRGLLTGLGAMVKFAPFALVPLMAAGEGDRRPKRTLVFALAFLAAALLPLVPFIPDGGLREFYDTTIGYQVGRESPFSIWGLEPSLGWLHTVVKAGILALGVLLFFVPRRRTPRQVAALAAAVLIASQLGAAHWFYLYLAWFVPPLLGALFAGHETPANPAPERRAGALAAARA